MDEVINKTLMLGGSIVALLMLIAVYVFSETTTAAKIAVDTSAVFRHRIFKALAIITVIELLLEVSVFALGFLGQNDHTLTEFLFVPRLYLFSFIIWTIVFSYYVLSIRKDLFKKIRNSRRLKISVAVFIFIMFWLFMLLPMTPVNDGVTIYGKGILVDGFLVPIIIISLSFWIIVIFRHRKRLSSKFIPVMAVIALLILAIVIRFLNNGIIIFGLIHAIVIVVGLLTIDNKNKMLFEAESRARLAEVKANKVKDEFLGLASHQLRTPLTSIQGYASMLVEGDFGKLNAEQMNALSEVAGSASRMTFLISDLLNMSRLQSGKFLIEKAETNIGMLVKKEVDAMRILAESHDIKLVYDEKNIDKLPSIKVDAKKTGEVVANMIDNAIFYSPSGSKVEIGLKKNSGFIELRIKDHGIGVPKSEQDKLFTKFHRGSNARTKRPDGTGIGLYLAKKIITEQGGEIIFSSVEGEGSTFGFKFSVGS